MEGVVFGKLGPRFERVENLVLWSCRHFWFPTSTSDASGSFSVAGTIFCRPRQKSGWDLGKTLFLNVFELFLTFSMFIFCAVRIVLWKSNMCLSKPSHDCVRVRSLSLWCGANCDIARATLSALCARRIALVVVRCELWYRSRNPLGILCASDRSPCGAVRIVISLAQPSWHFVSAGSLSLWRGLI